MILVVLGLVVVAVGVATIAVAALIVRGGRRQLAAQHEATLEATRQALAAERDHTVQSAVDTVLAVAGEKLADHRAAATRELDLRNEAFGEQARQIASELTRVQQLVAELQRERAEQHGRLEHGLDEALRASASLASTTQALRETLASTQARGQWGERMAEDVLRSAGFLEGVNYRKQATIPGGGRPDFTFDLPRDRVLHMDVKFPLDNYQRALTADDPDQRARFEAAFLSDVKARIKEIAGRGYIDPERTVEAVLLFIPNESIYGFVHERDPQLIDAALAQKVVLCSPFTLFAVLAVVRQAVDAFLLERTSNDILECLAGFSDQWARFSDSLDKLGKRLESTQSAFDDLSGTRRRQLQRHLDRIDALRVEHGLETDREGGVLDAGGLATGGPGAHDVDVDADDEPARHDLPAAVNDTAGAPSRRRLRPVRLK